MFSYDAKLDSYINYMFSYKAKVDGYVYFSGKKTSF